MSVLYRSLELPLFNAAYSVFVSNDSLDLADSFEEEFPDVIIQWTEHWEKSASGFSYVAKHSQKGLLAIIIIKVGNGINDNQALGSIVEECTRVAWDILDSYHIVLDNDNHEIYPHVVKELVSSVKGVVDDFTIKYGNLGEI